jgi:hypothetical protein
MTTRLIHTLAESGDKKMNAEDLGNSKILNLLFKPAFPFVAFEPAFTRNVFFVRTDL